jgi:anti-sigma B factor antagonist
MQCHHDRFYLEETIRDYLLRRLDPETTETFEGHYLGCDECFEQLQASQLLIAGLDCSMVARRQAGAVTVLHFTGPAQLTRQSQELAELFSGITQQSDTKVLVDLSRVSKIDSTGLGLLISCYSRAVKNHGMLKLLRPSAEIQNLLHLTGIQSVLETYQDEQQALQSFNPD